MKKIVLAVAALAAIAIPAMAQALGTMGTEGPSYSRAFNSCMSRARGGAAVGVCLNTERRRWDNDLNATYQQVMANLSSGRRIALRDDERNWIVHRDETCGRGGSLDVTQCVLDETIRRTRYLKSFQ
jgi:uncharacterized protein YecT (DUF1311 family)